VAGGCNSSVDRPAKGANVHVLQGRGVERTGEGRERVESWGGGEVVEGGGKGGGGGVPFPSFATARGPPLASS
jgi:hypothetical protein